MIQTVTAIERDGFDVRVLTILFEIPDKNFDIRKAIKDVCTEFVSTPKGKRIYAYNCGCFNWADFEMHVPDELCEKHGFKKVHSEVSDMEVNWDKHLVNDSALNADEEEA